MTWKKGYHVRRNSNEIVSLRTPPDPLPGRSIKQSLLDRCLHGPLRAMRSRSGRNEDGADSPVLAGDEPCIHVLPALWTPIPFA